MCKAKRIALIFAMGFLPFGSVLAANANPSLNLSITCACTASVSLEWGAPANAPTGPAASPTSWQTWTIASLALGGAATASASSTNVSLWNGGGSGIYVQIGVFSIAPCIDGATYWQNNSASGYPALNAFQLYFAMQVPGTAWYAFPNGTVGMPANQGAAAMDYLNAVQTKGLMLLPSQGQPVDLSLIAPTTCSYASSGPIAVIFTGTSY